MELTDFHQVDCCRCGVLFAFSEKYESERRGDHEIFYCPNGHGNHYPGKSKIEKLQDEILLRNAEIARREATETRLRDELATEERRRRSLKGKVTLIRNRIARGACPCCRSKFPDLENHMKTKHPNYAKGKKVKA